MLEQIVASHDLAVDDGINALLLGVTPEITQMRWPEHTHLTAVDRNTGMIGAIWSGYASPEKSVTCGDWLKLPFTDAAFNTVAGDGCFTLQSYPDGYTTLFTSIHRILVAGGLFVTRYFLRPEIGESSEAVFADLYAGKIGNFHILKWRLAHALHGSIEDGVKLADIWNSWHQQGIDMQSLANKLGWSVESIRTIDVYRNVNTCYTFPTLSEIRALSNDGFRETDIHYGDYELGERCPTVSYLAR